MMTSKNGVNLSGVPLSKTVLTAKRYRLETRRRESALAAGVLSVALGLSTWGCLTLEAQDTSAAVSLLVVVLALLLVCILQALVLNCVERIALLPATPSQLEHVEQVRGLPAVAQYLAAVEANKRSLTRREAATIIVYSRRQPGSGTATVGKKERQHVER